MNTDIQIFNNPSFGEIRTSGTSEEPLFCLADICHAIGIKDISRCASRLDDDMRQTHPIIDRLGRTQQATFVTEGGLYDVIIRSDSESAKPFRRWVSSEVLPAIRKTGQYKAQKARKREPSMTTQVRISLEWVKGVSEILNLNDSSKLYLLEKVAEPMKLPLPKYTDSKGVLFSATELLKRVGANISIRDFNKKMKEFGFLSERTRKSSKGEKRFNVLSETCSEYGENQVSPHNPKETQPLYYEGRFSELLQKIGAL